MRMNAKKKVMLALFVLTILVGGFLVARGYPDWALNVIQKEGTTFVVTGSVDANITNAEINAYVTNTTITIEPSEGAEFIIKPAEAVVFQIQGQVDANITNTELNVNVTNSVLDVNVQGTANVEIQNAQLNVKTLREQASEAENITYARDFLDLDSDVVQGKIIYKNEGNTTVYLEAVYAAIKNSDTYDSACFIDVSILDPDGYTVAEFYANPPNFPLNFDPAVPIPPGYSIEVYAYRWVNYGYTVSVSLLIRTA